MITLTLKPLARTYANNGQHAEQVFRYTLTDTILRADNVSAEKSADVLDIQIKSARATISNSLDLADYLARDKAQRYAYVMQDFKIAYIMSKAEWYIFCLQFARADYDSHTHNAKLRLPKETKSLVQWLQSH